MRFCPYCGGDLAPHLAAAGNAVAAPATPATGGKYDQDAIWKGLVTEAASRKATPPAVMSLVTTAMSEIGTPKESFSTIVHLVFDREIVPRGGVLHKATLLEGRTEMNLPMLEAMGYAVRDGHVVLVDEIPVGKAYEVLSYWGGEKQHKRWHLAEPIALNASRSGNPFFMDMAMVAFGAKWRDQAKLSEALMVLCELFITGVAAAGLVAVPLGLKLHLQ